MTIAHTAAITDVEIIQYYDQCHVDYQIVWHLDSHLSIHYGYWDETTPNLRAALLRMNAKVAEMAGIGSSDRVLDAGCGVGGSSFFLAKNYGCTVTGISLSRRQVGFAQKKAAELHLSNQVSFSARNYLDTGFPDGSFDVVWAIESVCHAADKALFLKEAFRLLKKGGRLVVADFFRTPAPFNNRKQPDVLQKWIRCWAIPDLDPVDAFMEKAAGYFSSVEAVNITPQIYPSARRLYQCFVPGVICDGALRLLGKRTVANKANVWSTFYQYKSLKSNMWSYNVVKAVK